MNKSRRFGFIVFMFIVFICAVIGVATISIFTHEFVHKYQASSINKTSETLCGLCIGSDKAGFYSYHYDSSLVTTNIMSEPMAYTAGIIIIIIFTVYFIWGIIRYSR